jgi:hypothetical protein
MPDTAETYRYMAAQCRRLAGALPGDGQIGRALLALAAEFDVMALEAEVAERGGPGRP